jgi:hypothetical protein
MTDAICLIGAKSFMTVPFPLASWAISLACRRMRTHYDPAEPNSSVGFPTPRKTLAKSRPSTTFAATP